MPIPSFLRSFTPLRTVALVCFALALTACSNEGTCQFETSGLGFCWINMGEEQCSGYKGSKFFKEEGTVGEAHCALDGYKAEGSPKPGEMFQFSKEFRGACIEADACDANSVKHGCGKGEFKEAASLEAAKGICAAAGYSRHKYGSKYERPTN